MFFKSHQATAKSRRNCCWGGAQGFQNRSETNPRIVPAHFGTPKQLSHFPVCVHRGCLKILGERPKAQGIRSEAQGIRSRPSWQSKIAKRSIKGRRSAPGNNAQRVFDRFSCRRRSKSLPGSIFGRSNPRKLCSHHSGSTILAKSPFSKKHRTGRLRKSVLGPKIAQNRCRSDQKSPKLRNHMICVHPIFQHFFGHRKTNKCR